jgi:hemerythrin-like domain-containing protein
MNLNDLPHAIEDPLDALFHFHRRIEKKLAELVRLGIRLETDGIDAKASDDACSLIGFFERAVPIHHADEEHDFFPLLASRTASAAERDEMQGLRHRLEGDHREIERSWQRLRRPLAAVGEGIERRIPTDLSQYFRAIHAVHISAEEAGLHAIAARRLLPNDRILLARRMSVRRSVTRPSYG